jgi:TIR domain
MGIDGQDSPKSEPRILRIFISYASEDLQIASAIANAFRLALGDVFAEINLDKWFLQAGDEFKKQIETKLEKTDIFVVVYTGVEKQSHSFTGWELGYFDRIMKSSPDRKMIPLFLESLPGTIAGIQGITLNIPRERLQVDLRDFESNLIVNEDDPMCALIAQMQDQVDGIRAGAGYSKPVRDSSQDPVTRVKEMKLQIFRYLKSTVETTLKPQKQITIKVKAGSLHEGDTDLPPQAELVPTGSGSMEIFGLADGQMTWEKFLQLTGDNKFRDSWRDAITSVVMSSFPDRINVDNSQIIVSSDETKTYRLILTTATKYYNDNREFNVYFVESLPKPDFGDANTTSLLKGLELVCRFRFMFLENDSQFSSRNLLVNPIERFPSISKGLLRELNLLRKDSREAGLDQPTVWGKLIKWETIEHLAAEYRPRELKIRETVRQISALPDGADGLVPLRQNLADILKDLEERIRPTNSDIIDQMTDKLKLIIKDS